jgi:hypothetical protein
MTTPSGQISLSDVNTELGYSATALITMNDAAVRTLAGVGGSGTVITMQNLQGKSNQFNLTISSNTANANLATLATNAGWNGTTKVVATISSGVYVYSTSTGSAGLTISGTFPNGVSLINNGYILGQGGNGGNGGNGGTNGSGGGLALSVSTAVSITNNNVIGGGGGGGGGGGYAYCCSACAVWGGGGGGGGQTGLNNSSGGSPGPNFYQNSRYPQPGGAGTSSGAGAGGIGGASPNGVAQGGYGGNGGGWGASGSGGSGGAPKAGGSGGAATSGSATYITWVATGTRYGSIG